MTRERGAVLVAVLIMAGTLVLVLGQSDNRLAATNTRIERSGVGVIVAGGDERCQGRQFVPRKSASLRLGLSTLGRESGEPLDISIRARDGQLVRGVVQPGGYRQGEARVGFEPLERDVQGGTFCVRNLGASPMGFGGAATSSTLPAEDRPGEEIRVDWFRAGRESWWTLAPEIARRFPLFKASFFGPWTLWVTLGSVVAIWAVALWALLKAPGSRAGSGMPADARVEPGQRPPGLLTRARGWLTPAGWTCAGIALVNAALWAAITPVFQVMDEPAHAGYTQYLADRGRPPLLTSQRKQSVGHETSERTAIEEELPYSTEGKPSWSKLRDTELRRRLASGLKRSAEDATDAAANYPPLYYGVEAIPTRLAVGTSALDRLYAMRLVSAVMSAATVAFVYLFVRELLPAEPWTWAVGALMVAFQPVFGFFSGGVNNDSLLFATAAALLWLLVRSFRRGLTPRRGVAVGLVTAAGVLTKPTMLALLPFVLAALAVMVARSGGWRTGPALRSALLAVGTLGLATAGWFLVDVVVFNRAGAGGGEFSASLSSGRTSLRGQLSYLWQFFFPKLWFMHEEFPGYPQYPVWETYVQGFVGRFGWFQYGFSPSVNRLGLGALAVMAVLAALALVRARDAVRRHRAELLCYALALGSLLLLNGIVGYRFRAATGLDFEQPRYLFTLLALYGAVAVMAARGLGRRWAPAAGAFLVVLAMGHSLFSMLLTISRYYA